MDGVNLTKWFLHARGQFVIGQDDEHDVDNDNRLDYRK